MAEGLAQWLRRIVSPCRCGMCGARMATDEGIICPACSARLPRRDDTLNATDNSAARLVMQHVGVCRGAAWVDYVPRSEFADMIYGMKYHRHPETALKLGIMIAREMLPGGFFDGIDTIVPLPLHPIRERERGYNQSREFAHGLSRVLRLPVEDGAVARIRNTRSQTSLMPSQRMANVECAFSVTQPGRLRGRHALLVDDIVTTGASLSACMKEMAAVEGVRLSFLTIGKTLY